MGVVPSTDENGSDRRRRGRDGQHAWKGPICSGAVANCGGGSGRREGPAGVWSWFDESKLLLYYTRLMEALFPRCMHVAAGSSRLAVQPSCRVRVIISASLQADEYTHFNSAPLPTARTDAVVVLGDGIDALSCRYHELCSAFTDHAIK